MEVPREVDAVEDVAVCGEEFAELEDAVGGADGGRRVGELELEVAREHERAPELAEDARHCVQVCGGGDCAGCGGAAGDYVGFETEVGGCESGGLGADGGEDVGCGGVGGCGVGEEGEGGGGGEGVDVGVDFLEVEEDAGERGGEVDGGVGGVVGGGYECAGEGVGGEGGREEGLVVDVGDFGGVGGGHRWRGRGKGGGGEGEGREGRVMAGRVCGLKLPRYRSWHVTRPGPIATLSRE